MTVTHYHDYSFKYKPGDILTHTDPSDGKVEDLKIHAILIDSEGALYDFFAFYHTTDNVEHSSDWVLKESSTD